MKMNDELWASKWLPKFGAALEVLESSVDSAFMNVREFSRLIRRIVATATENSSLRVPAIRMIQQSAHYAPNSEQLGYILSARSSLPWAIAELIDTICQQVADEAEANFANTHWIMRLELKREKAWVDDEYYPQTAYRTMTPNEFGEKQYKLFSRRLKEWYKFGIWNGDEEHLGTRDFTDRLTRFKQGKEMEQ